MYSEIFSDFIPVILKQIHPELELSESAIKLINDILTHIEIDILELSHSYILDEKLSEITLKEVDLSVKKLFSGDLKFFAIREGNKSVIKYFAQCGKNIQSKSDRAGLIFPILYGCQIVKKIDTYTGGKIIVPKISENAIVFLTGVLEYICAEIVELSGDVANIDENDTVIPANIIYAITKDTELKKLTNLETMDKKFYKSKKSSSKRTKRVSSKRSSSKRTKRASSKRSSSKRTKRVSSKRSSSKRTKRASSKRSSSKRTKRASSKRS